MRRAVDLSSGGEVDEGKFESEAEVARKKMEAEYQRMRQMPSELRGRDRKRARLLENKKRLLGEVLEEVGLEAPPHPAYLHPVQEEVKEQEPRSRAGGLSISKVGEGFRNVPPPARQQDQAKVAFSLKDFIERKKKAEEEEVEQVEDDSDIEEVGEVKRDTPEEDGNSTDDDVSMDDDTDSDLELIKSDKSGEDKKSKKYKDGSVSDIDDEIEKLNNIIDEYGPKPDDAAEVHLNGRDNKKSVEDLNPKHDIAEELTEMDSTEVEDLAEQAVRIIGASTLTCCRRPATSPRRWSRRGRTRRIRMRPRKTRTSGTVTRTRRKRPRTRRCGWT